MNTLETKPIVVKKFGGASNGHLTDPSKDRNILEYCKNIILPESEKEQIIVVVSAVRGMTDELKSIANDAAERKISDKDIFEKINEINNRHRTIFNKIIDDENKSQEIWVKEVEPLFGTNIPNKDSLFEKINAISILGTLPDEINAIIQSFGERLAAILVAYGIRKIGKKSRNNKFKRIYKSKGKQRRISRWRNRP